MVHEKSGLLLTPRGAMGMLTIPFSRGESELIHTKLFSIMPGTWQALCLNLLLQYRRSAHFNMAYGFSTLQWCGSGMQLLQEGGPLPGPETGLFSNTRK